MKEAMWKVDPEGDFSFSDTTDPNQLDMFKEDQYNNLSKILKRKFCGVGYVTGRDIEDYVEEKSMYLKTHKTKALKLLEENAEITVKPVKMNGGRRRRHQYPKEALIIFHE